MTAFAYSSTSGSTTFPAASAAGGFPVHATGQIKQCPARALAIRVEILRGEMQHCLEQRARHYAMADAYLEEFQDLRAQVDQLRPSMLSAALRVMRDTMLRAHPDFAGAVPLPRSVVERESHG